MFNASYLLSAFFFLFSAFPVTVQAANVPVGFSETSIPGPYAGNWNDAVGLTFETNGRMYVWERTGRVWIKDPGDTNYSVLLDISAEVGAWEDHGMLGFAFDPNFRVNGYIYLLYVVDRHHLLNFGTGSYNPNSNDYNSATIGRVTRYTCTSSNNFRSVNLASRLVLIGETKATGFPILSYTHGIGSLAFAEDGTLLASCGDGATADTADQGGTVSGSYAPQGLADGMIQPKENIGGLRSQLVDCLGGKIVRIDPATGNGVSSNPYYQAGSPRSARSRVWTVGVRNPFRFGIKPESGSHDPADGNPGILYFGDVGWNTLECLRVVTAPKQNCGWPLFEGLSATGNGYNGNVANLDAPNPYFPTNACSQYFTFADLLKADTTNAAGQPPFNNPCNAALKIPASIPQFLHTRPVLDWNHASATTRTPTYGAAGQALTANVGAGGSPVSGTQFSGNCAVGGTWYTGTNFPLAYQNRYYFADWGQGLIKTLTFDTNNKPVALGDFASGAGFVVSVVQHPTEGSLYYISYNFSGATVQRVDFAGNRTPAAVASADQYFGVTPLTVQLSSSGSSDPDGQPLAYSWNFGDGSPLNTNANPSHTFVAPAGVPTKFVVTLTVTDTGSLSSQATFNVSVNNTPPNVAINSPTNGAPYSTSNATLVNLAATVNDTESADGQLLYQWQVLFHHNDHNHGSPPDTNHVTTAVIEPTSCDGINIYYYRVVLTVTDPHGLSTVREVRLFPACGLNTPPVISGITNQTTWQDAPAGPVPFTVGDAEVAAANLQLSAGSSNPALVPNGNIVFGGSGSNRTVTVTPAGSLTGTATITVAVSDGPNSVSTNFVVTVIPSITTTKSFTNAAVITILDSSAGTPYPSPINVAGLSGTITNVTVTLRGLTHSWLSDVDVLLVGPGGQAMILMSDCGDGPMNNANNVTLTLSNGAAASLPASGIIGSGTFRPTDFALGSADIFPGPAPAGPYGTNFSTFTGLGANGAWSLYVFDDGPGDVGSIANGWSLTITTVAASSSNTAPTITAITNQITTINTPETGIAFTIGDAQTAASNLVLSAMSANTTLVPTNNIVFGGTGANRTVNITPASNQLGTATITLIVSDGTLSASNSFVQSVNPASLVVTENSASRSYGATNPVLTGSVTGLQAGDVITATFTSAAATNSPVGSYPISFTLSDPGGKLGNYIVTTNNGTLTVTNAPLTVTENSASRSYGATNPVLTGSVTGLRVGDVITASFTTAAATNSPVGVYPITVTLSDPGSRLGNYSVTTNNGTLTVTQSPLLVKANNTNKVYRVVLTFGGGEFTIISGALVNGNTLTNVSLSSPGTGKGAKVGTYPITASAAQGLGLTNYSITYSNGVLTVGPANLTVAATSQSKPYGTSLALPTNGYTTTEMEDGDSVTNVSLDSDGAAGTAPAGMYAITPTNALGLGLTNYTIGYSNGTLTVAQAPLIATAEDKSRAYGQPNPAFTLSITGFMNGEGTNVLNSLPFASSTATNTTAPGSYPITLAGGADDNYSFSLVAGSLSISPPGNITITTVEMLDADHLRLIGTGDADVSYQVQASVNLQTWQTLGTATANGSGAFEFVDALAGGFTARFYRVATP